MTQQEVTLLERQIAKYKSVGVILRFSNMTPTNTKTTEANKAPEAHAIPILTEIVDIRENTKQPLIINCAILNNGVIELNHEFSKNAYWKEWNLNTIYFENNDNLQLTNLNQTVQNIDYLRNLIEYADDMLLKNPGIIPSINKLFQYNYTTYADIHNFNQATEFISLINKWYFKKISYYIYEQNKINTAKGIPIIPSNTYYASYDMNRHNTAELAKIQITKLPKKVANTVKAQLSRIMQLFICCATQDKNIISMGRISTQEIDEIAKSILKICVLVRQQGQSVYPVQLV